MDTAVVIPVHNDRLYIGEAIRSVQAQTVQPDRFVVADNASTDGTLVVIRSLVPEETLAAATENIGMVANFQRAVKLVDSEFFAWLGSDDRLDPDFVKVTSDALRAHPESPVVVTAVRFIDPLGNTLRECGLPDVAAPKVVDRLRAYLEADRWTEVYGLYRRDELLESPGFVDRYGPDVILIWWYLLRGPLAYVDRPLYEYREFPRKSLNDVLQRIDPRMTVRARTHNTDLWFDLLRESWRPGVRLGTRWVATRELVRALDGDMWRARIDEDHPHRRQALLLRARALSRRLSRGRGHDGRGDPA